jgi:hypothetical protein
MNLLKPPVELRNGYKDKQRLSDIHNIPCSLCLYLNQKQTSRTTAHHKTGMGLGKKASDLLTMSLCDNHHQRGQDAIHHIGTKTFEEKFIDQDSLILLTNEMLSKLN